APRRHRGPAAALRHADPPVVLRGGAAAVQGGRPAARPRDRLDRLHPRALPEEAAAPARSHRIPGMTSVDALVARVASHGEAEARRQILQLARVPRDVALVERLADEVPARARVDMREAERLADASAWVAEEIGDDYALGRAVRARGHVLALQGRSD